MAINCLTIDQKTEIVSARVSGYSLGNIAKEYKVSPDTISRVVKEAGPVMDIFKRDGDTFTLNQKIHIARDLNVAGIEITGDEKDGVVVCADLYVSDSKNLALECRCEPGDFSLGGVLKVGVLITQYDNYSTADDYANIIVDPTQPGPNVETLSEMYQIKTILDKPEPVPVWSATSKFISITVGRDSYSAQHDHPSFKAALQLLIDDRVVEALELISTKRAIEKYTSKSNKVKIEDGRLYYEGVEIQNSLVTRIIEKMAAGEDFEFFVPFLENLMLNPSRKVVSRVFDFLNANDIEITADGNFTAWKRVRGNYLDLHSGTMDNSPGKLVIMHRNQVDEDDNVTCSSGLHVCSKSYLPVFGAGDGNRVVSVSVNPRDVVSVPVDYGNAKMRTCAYLVLEDMTHLF